LHEGTLAPEGPDKTSKSKNNVDNPDELCDKYGADTCRMYEMFLDPADWPVREK